MGCGCVTDHSATDQRLASARAFLGNTKTSVADTNKESPATARPPYKLPVLLLIAPIAEGPTKPLRLAMEVINAMPEAAEYPVRNSLGIVQKGPRKL
jgi:hypothetical protein